MDGRVETESDRILEVRRAEIRFRRGAKLVHLTKLTGIAIAIRVCPFDRVAAGDEGADFRENRS